MTTPSYRSVAMSGLTAILAMALALPAAAQTIIDSQDFENGQLPANWADWPQNEDNYSFNDPGTGSIWLTIAAENGSYQNDIDSGVETFIYDLSGCTTSAWLEFDFYDNADEDDTCNGSWAYWDPPNGDCLGITGDWYTGNYDNILDLTGYTEQTSHLISIDLMPLIATYGDQLSFYFAQSDNWTYGTPPTADGLLFDNVTIWCDAVETDCTDGIDNDGDGDADCADSDCQTDQDGDGVTGCDGDCDDADDQIYPGQTEICDGIDNDCDGDVDCDDNGVPDADADGSCECDDCDDNHPAVFPGAPEIQDVLDNDCDGLVDEDFIAVGDLVITELMTWTAQVADGNGEWFEITNMAPFEINLVNWVIDDQFGGVESHTVAGDLLIPPAGIAVICLDDDPSTNGGFGCDYQYDMGLTGTQDDEVLLTLEGTTIDGVRWGTAWGAVQGTAWSLDPTLYDETANDDPASWCLAVDAYGDGDLGTPGAVNPSCCFDLDGDGVDSCSGDCDDTDDQIYPGAPELLNGLDDDCDGLIDEDFVGVGDLIVTEIMHNPLAVADAEGEWIELYNNGAATIDLFGLEIYDHDLDWFMVDDHVFIAPGDTVVLGTELDSLLNGGYFPDYVYGYYTGMLLNSGGQDELVLEYDGVVIDEVIYTVISPWPAAEGFSLSLDPAYFDDMDNDDGANWCLTDTAFPYGDGDFGTPGTVNPACCFDLDGDGISGCDGDCDDGDASTYPGATELCDSVDNDCNGQIDDGVLTYDFWPDADGDGYGDTNGASVNDCAPPTGYADNDADCDDTDAAINPGAGEICDGVDQDCDGVADNGLPFEDYYPDADGDGYGDVNGTPVNACAAPSGSVPDGTDCDDGDATVNPGAAEICDGLDQDCDGVADNGLTVEDFYPDADGDGYGDVNGTPTSACVAPSGYAAGNTDCDDGDAAINPGALEVACDGVDNDCDGAQHGDESDDDGDGETECDGDCDDTDAAINTSATELCDGLDNDCDGTADDGLTFDDYYPDVDGDGYGDDNAAATNDCVAPSGMVADNTDCDDTEAAVNPGATEICDGLDNDCDGNIDDGLATADYYPDLDGDGFGDDGAAAVTDCAQPEGFTTDNTDCDDGDATVYPGAPEYCDNIDNDCNGTVDDNVVTADYYPDADADGYGDVNGTPINDCNPPSGYVADGTDCDDADPLINPGAPEIACDGIDNDCDGAQHEQDVDDDGDGASECDGDCDDTDPALNGDDADGDGFSNCDGDCDDTDDTVFPGAEELCDSVDSNCDGIDDNTDIDGDGFSICDGDCDEADPAINPDAEEICDGGIDNDCDPATVEDVDGDGDGQTICDGDCDDADATIYDGATEICDGLDNDCDGALDFDEVDGDGDGYMVCEGDCDDADALTYPGAPEQCDNLDNDCDGLVDEDVNDDGDSDGYTPCDGDCDDTDPAINPGATEVCDGADTDCDGIMPTDEVDADGDGYMECDGDCDDADATVNPGADEDCGDLVDDDCDGVVDNLDADGDGFIDSDCDGGDDCDDADDTVNPDATEICDDGFDNDCDGDVDGDDPDCGTGDDDTGDDDTGDDDTGDDDTGDDDTGDDDTTGDDDDDTSGDDDSDDGEVAGGCECEGNQAATAPVSVALLFPALAAMLMIRRRR